MTAVIGGPGTEAAVQPADVQVAGRRKGRRRVTTIWIGRVVLAVIVIGGWQWFTAAGWVDKFFFGQPSEIWNSLVKLFTQGTAFGTIWENLWVTAKEAFGGYGRSNLPAAGATLGSSSWLTKTGSPR